jgi:5-oxopent-3-ene-1,2,5-tricarboxylate decarboxylase/2-hydroxyhepta-2,4-diene-1,7-dioate isomerase
MKLMHCWHLWLCEGNYREVEALEGIPVRPHVLAYQAPVTSLTEGGPVVLPAHAGRIACSCELGFEIGQAIHQASETEATRIIRGYRVLAGFRDLSLIDEVPLPTPRDEGVCTYYARWADTFNLVGPLVRFDRTDEIYDAEMKVEIEGVQPTLTHTRDYLHRAPAVIAALSQFATLQPGDLISLGRAGVMVKVPADRLLERGTRVRAEIKGIGEIEGQVEDRRLARTEMGG